MNKLKNIDKKVIVFPIIVIVLLCVLVNVIPDTLTNIIKNINTTFCFEFTIFYHAVNFFLFLLSIYLAFSKYGNIVLGKEYEKKKIPFWGWGAMMFCSGIAGDLIYFSSVDWAMHMSENYVHTLGDATAYSVVFASYSWIFFFQYVVVAAALGFTIFVRKRDNYKFSESLRPVLGKQTDGLIGDIVNIFVVIILLLGVACSQCFSVPIISSIVINLFHVKLPANVITLISMLIILAIYSTSVCNGLKGIEFLSKICVYVYLFLLLYVLIFGGEFISILGLAFNEIGIFLDKIIFLFTDVNPLRTGADAFSQNNNAFYIAYWFTWAITTPFFIAIISRGRKVKELVFGGYAFAIPGSLIGFFVISNFMAIKQSKMQFDFLRLYQNSETGFDMAYEMCARLPMKEIAMVIMIISMICFTASSLDSLSLSASYFSYKKITHKDVPDKKIRLMWAIALMALPFFITLSNMDYSIIQDIVILFGVAAAILMILLVIAFFKDANKYLEKNR